LEENFEALDKEMADLKEKKEEIENEIKTEEAKKEKSDFKTDKCICNKKLEEYQEQIKQIENDIILYVGALDFIFDESEKAKKELDDIIKELEEGGKKDLKKEAKELTPPPPPSKESSKAKS
jgi:predicted nuclease with TOPRIM domain